jgi:fucose permease
MIGKICLAEEVDKMSKRSSTILIIYIFFMMFLSAMYDNVKGPFVPIIKQEFLIDNKGIATTLTICSLGYMLFTFIGGILCEKIGQKKVFILGFILMTIASTGLYFSSNFTMYLIGLFLLNMGQAFIAIATNTIIPILVIGSQAILMNLTHFSYGVGATFTQRFTGMMLYNDVTWRYIYLIIAIISFLMLIGFLFVKVPKSHLSKENRSINYKEVFTNKLIYPYMMALGFYVAAEMNTGNWFVNYMYDSYKYNEVKSSIYAALFFGMFTAGRLFGGFVAEKLGFIRSVLFSVIIACILNTLGLILGERGIVVISISGLFFAITFPTLVLTISKVFKKNTSYITGIIITSASFISLLINGLIGILNDSMGVYKAYYTISLSLGLSAMFIYIIYINTNHMGEKVGE